MLQVFLIVTFTDAHLVTMRPAVWSNRTASTSTTATAPTERHRSLARCRDLASFALACSTPGPIPVATRPRPIPLTTGPTQPCQTSRRPSCRTPTTSPSPRIRIPRHIRSSRSHPASSFPTKHRYQAVRGQWRQNRRSRHQQSLPASSPTEAATSPRSPRSLAITASRATGPRTGPYATGSIYAPVVHLRLRTVGRWHTGRYAPKQQKVLQPTRPERS